MSTIQDNTQIQSLNTISDTFIKILEEMPEELKFKVELVKVIAKGSGVEVTLPIIPRAFVTAITKDGNDDPRPVMPAYVNNVEEGNISAAIVSICKEIELLLNTETTWKWKCVEGPVVVSANIPKNGFAFDFHDGHVERIVVNEEWAEGRAVDADGDRCFLLWIEDTDQALFVKFPITKRPALLTLIKGRVRETFYSLGLENRVHPNTGVEMPGLIELFNSYVPANKYGRSMTGMHKQFEGEKTELNIVERDGVIYAAQDEKVAFFKSHEPVEVGILTSALNTEELYNTVGLKYEAKVRQFMTDPKRYEIIELQALKAARKDSKSFDQTFTFNKVLKREYAWNLTSANSITSQKAKDVLHIADTNLERLMDKLVNIKLLKTDFRAVKNTASVKEQPKTVTVDNKLISRLLTARRLKVDAFPHTGFPFDPKNIWANPCVVALYLTLPSGKITGLTDVKRSDDGRKEGLTYCYLLPPVWNAELGKYLHPLEHLALEFACKIQQDENGRITSVGRFDSRIINPETQEITGFFGTNVDYRGDFLDHFIKYSIKVPMLMNALAEYCGEYGIPVDGDKTEYHVMPSEAGLDTAQKTVIIDYMRDSSALEMWEIAKQANKALRICLGGNKQSKRRVRKYAMAHANGVAIWAPKNAHIARPGKQLAQRARALKICRMKTAVVYMDTLTQTYLTPSGVEKQISNRSFLPRTFPTFERWMKFAESAFKDAAEIPSPTSVLHPTWSGEMRRTWIADARVSMEVGKLIDDVGNKFVPRRTRDQFVTEAGENIDVLLPLPELMAKGAIRAMFGDEIPKHLIQKIKIPTRTLSVSSESDKWDINGISDEHGLQTVTEYIEIEAVVFDWTYYRTGSASENVPARRRWCSIKGFDKYGVMDEMSKHVPDMAPLEVDLTIPKMLQGVIVKLRTLASRRG